MSHKTNLEIHQTIIGDNGIIKKLDLIGIISGTISCLVIAFLVFLGVMAYIG